MTLQQKVGPLDRPHDFRLQYNYRERLFNGSLGFQTVNNSFGGIVVSPIIPLWITGLELSYQGSIQSIFAPTDRQDLLISDPEDNLVNLVRYQGAASLSRPISSLARLCLISYCRRRTSLYATTRLFPFSLY